MEITYYENGDLALFNGMKFRRDKQTGYFLNSSNRIRLHRAVWIQCNGEIPKGFHIHHIDGDKNNNEISNLKLISGSAHCSHHGNERAASHYDEMYRNLMHNAIPKAAIWHGSPAGREWHSRHAKEVIANMTEKEYNCLHCGKKFCKKPIGPSKFCSNACKSAYRRKLGVDNITKQCEHCSGDFESNKYQKARFCSAACRSAARKTA